MERRPAIIIGSGPAGAASALFLHASAPGLAHEVLLLDKARHPRPKVCAGGLIPHTLSCLRELDVPLAVPNVPVRRARVDIPGTTVSYDEGCELCRVVRRDEFDASLVDACAARRIEVRQGEKVVELHREADGVRIETDGGSYHARVVIGADGSGSLVRRRLVDDDRVRIGRAVMAEVPVTAGQWDGVAQGRYEFRFTAVPEGLRGYAWAFPCLIAGAPHVNVGVYSVATEGTGGMLGRVLEAELARVGATDASVKSFPIRWYGRGSRIAAPRVLLAGDAAGVDPLMGEGISYAFEYGRRAAAATARALTGGDLAFADYERAVADSWMGTKLRRLHLGVQLFYGPAWRAFFALAAHSRHLQDVGIRWFNGVDGWDRRSAWALVGAWLWGTQRPAAAR